MNRWNDSIIVDVYRRILKYPSFVPKRQKGAMKITHNLENGYVEITAAEYVTVEDAEKLFALIHLAKDVRFGEETATAQVHIKEIRKLTNCNNDKYIEKALQRIASVTITAHYTEKKLTHITHMLHDAKLDYATGIIKATFNRRFFELCKEKSLSLNLTKYSRLSPVAKNLYSFIVSNSGDVFSEDLLIERAVISATRKNNAQRIIKHALDELIQKHVIKSYKRTKKNGRWYVFLQKHTAEELSTAVAKNYPQQ